jgi:hypothetical protein
MSILATEVHLGALSVYLVPWTPIDMLSRLFVVQRGLPILVQINDQLNFSWLIEAQRLEVGMFVRSLGPLLSVIFALVSLYGVESSGTWLASSSWRLFFEGH